MIMNRNMVNKESRLFMDRKEKLKKELSDVLKRNKHTNFESELDKFINIISGER